MKCKPGIRHFRLPNFFSSQCALHGLCALDKSQPQKLHEIFPFGSFKSNFKSNFTQRCHKRGSLIFRGFHAEAFRSGKKKITKINFLGPEAARWGGGLPREGVVAKMFVPSLESLSSLGFEERTWEFCRDVPDPWGCTKIMCKNISCALFVPYQTRFC